MNIKAKYLFFVLLLNSTTSFSATPERSRSNERDIDQARSIEHDRTQDRDRDRIYDKSVEKKVLRIDNLKIADVELTRKLRERIMAENQLSTRAKNIQITTADEAILLEGPVANREEKVKIENLARTIAGKKKVYNRLTY